jgi:hypothetical protein
LADLRETVEQRDLTLRKDEEAKEREQSAHQDAAREASEAQLERIAELEAEVQHAQAARREADVQREDAVQAATEAQLELSTLRDAAQQNDLATGGEEEAKAEAVARQDAEASDKTEPQIPAPTSAISAAEASGPAKVEATIAGQSQSTAEKATLEPDDVVPDVPDAQSIAQSRRDKVVGVKVDPAAANPENKRFERRVTSQMSATLLGKGMSQPLACNLRDRSPGGAKLEYTADKFFSSVSKPVVGDKLTLTLNNARERTSLSCVVVWTTGSSCGVRFAGQFYTQANHPKNARRSSAATKPKSAAGRLAKAVVSGLSK